MRVVIADDSTLLREGLAQLLREASFDVVATVGDGRALIEAVATDAPDLCIVDIRMPPTHTDEGLAAAAELRRDHPDVAVLLLSQYVHAGRALDLFERPGAGLGYLLKDRVTAVDGFLDAVRRVGTGGTAIDPEVISHLVAARRPTGPLDRLTERERDVLRLMAEGRSNASVARHLSVGLKTVEGYVSTIFTKLDLPPAEDDNRRVLAVLTWLRDVEGTAGGG
ncbi:MAG: response regulator transcription factor [Acidimicrobiia bacterium]|nr:MAG: response regulator transcription factor [Acidimicrobiia bacterium]